MAEDTQISTEEVLLYVDFGKKVRDDVFLNKMFFRISNLETQNPLIQLNDNLFKGQYQDCAGTNLFFEDVEGPHPRRIFGPESSIHLRHRATQFKVLSVKSVKIPSNLKDVPKPEYDVKINTENDLETILKKLADGSLNLEDGLTIIPKGSSENVTPIPEQTSTKATTSTSKELQGPNSVELKIIKDVEMKEIVDNRLQSPKVGENDNSEEPKEIETQSVDILSHKYEKLKKLARRPTRRKIEPEHILQCDTKYQKAYEYNCIKSQVIKPSDYFPVISKKFDKDSLLGAVDIDRSVIQRVITPSSDYYRVLTIDEQTALLSMHNLDNLSMPARYWVLKSQLEHLESLMLTMTDDELSKEDMYGRTIGETAGIYKRLVRVLNGLVEQNYYYNSGEDTDDEESADEDLEKQTENVEEDVVDISIESVAQNSKKEDTSCDMEND